MRRGDVIAHAQRHACEKTAPWELPQDEGAFVQVFVRERRGAALRAFGAWRARRQGTSESSAPAKARPRRGVGRKDAKPEVDAALASDLEESKAGTPPPPRDFQTPNAAGTSPAYISVRRAFSDLNKILCKSFSFEDFRVTDSGKGKHTSDTHILVA